MSRKKKPIGNRIVDIISLEWMGEANREGFALLYVVVFSALFGIVLAPHWKPLLGVIVGILMGIIIWKYYKNKERGK